MDLSRAHAPCVLIADIISQKCALSFHRFAVVQVRNTYWANQSTAMIAEGIHNHSEI